MVERRKHKRYSMPRGTFIILRDKVERLRNHAQMNIGEIAMVLYKSEAEIIGQVTDMSLGGVAFLPDSENHPTEGEMELDLLMTEQGIYLHNIPYATVRDARVHHRDGTFDGAQRSALQFTDLDADQTDGLADLLSHHTG